MTIEHRFWHMYPECSNQKVQYMTKLLKATKRPNMITTTSFDDQSGAVDISQHLCPYMNMQFVACVFRAYMFTN